MAWIKQAKGDFSLGVFLPIPKSGRNGSLDDKWTFGWCWKGFCVVQFSATSASLHIIFIWEFLIQAKNYCRYIGTSSAVVFRHFSEIVKTNRRKVSICIEKLFIIISIIRLEYDYLLVNGHSTTFLSVFYLYLVIYFFCLLNTCIFLDMKIRKYGKRHVLQKIHKTCDIKEMHDLLTDEY